MKTEQTIDLSELKALLPEWATIEFQRKKGQTGTSLEVSVKMVPQVSLLEHNTIVESIIKHYGEDLHEVYTETTGYHFYVYLKLSATQPTTVTI